MVTKDQVLVDGNAVMAVTDVEATEGKLLGPLKSELLKSPLLPVEGEPGKLTRGEINIMADRAVPYSVLKKIMATCTDVRFASISLAVIRKLPGGDGE